MTTQGVLEAVSGAVGEADNEIGGFIVTRLTEVVAPTTALAAMFIWDGTTTVLTSDTSEVAIGDWINLKSPGELALAATFTWNGTTTITCPDTSEVEAGDWIRLGSDSIWYEIQSIVPNTSVTISNPGGFTIPTGSTQSLKGSEVDISGQLFQIVNLTFNTSVEIDNSVGYDIPSGTYPSSKATRNLPVESVLDWEDEGKVGLDGIVYYYASRTDTELQDVVHLRGGVLTVGVKKIHSVEAPVMDLNRSRTALDLLRRAMLVAYAEGDDLNALGRNLGVDRYPFLASDDVFREIVQAVAYNPKGTLFGIELALDALLGEGNYEIRENLIEYPCTVFIKLIGAASTDEISVGKAFLAGPEYQPPTSDTTVDIDDPVVTRGSVGSVRWKDENLLTDCRTAYPSADIITEYPGDTPHQAWSLVGIGAIEGTHITLVGTGPEDGATEFTLIPPFTTARYQRRLRLRPESYGWAYMLVTIPVGAPSETGIPTRMWFSDGGRYISIGVRAEASGFRVGQEAASFFPGQTAFFPRGQFVEVAVFKKQTEVWEIYVDGRLLTVVPYTWNTTATGGGGVMTVGVLAAGPTANRMQLKQMAVWGTTLTDYWAARGTGATVGIGGNQERLDVGSAFFVSTDVGKLVEVSGASNIENNGRFEIVSLVSSQAVDMQGQLNGGLEAQFSGSSTRVKVPESGQQFQYPDDINKELLISGSTAGNDGPQIITDLLHPGTLLSLGLGATPIPEKTTVAVCSGASYVPETGLSWRLNPVFVPEGGIDWELSDAGSVSGTTITLRQALPLNPSECYRVLQVLYSNVLSAQVLLNSLVDNEVIQTFPDLLFAYYPFYLADPLGYVRSYIDTLTAAGVIPDFLVE